MTTRAPDEILVDRLFEKHECFPDAASQMDRRPVAVGEATVQVLFPRHVPRVEIVSAAMRGDLLFLVGRIEAPLDWGVAGNGAVIVARRTSTDEYAVHVWHELHRGTLEHLVDSAGP